VQVPVFIARRFLARQKGTFSAFIIRLAIVATALGVAVMVIATALISGFKFTIREKLFSFWGQVLIVPYDAAGGDIVAAAPIIYDPQLFGQLKGMKGVVQVSPFAMRPAILQANSQIEGIRLKGIPESYRFSKAITFTGKHVSYTDTDYSRNIILSQTTASRLMLKAGDPLLLYSLEPGSARVRKLIISGVYHTGMEEVDKQFALCDIRLVQRLSQWKKEEISGYQIELANAAEADIIAAQMHEQYVSPPLEAYSISSIYEGIFSWLNMQDVNARILLIIVGVMAVINLGAALLILMVDRAVIVGLLKALGMPESGLRTIFLYLAGLIGLLGILLGNILGIGLCFLQQHYGFMHLPEDTYYMRTVPVRLLWPHILLIDCATLFFCVLCMALPTLYIRRIQPAKVLQFK
jgi:lipoprotein-releasing system permease protein